jgi:hypothetical protein
MFKSTPRLNALPGAIEETSATSFALTVLGTFLGAACAAAARTNKIRASSAVVFLYDFIRAS